jgi:hypothetical protein
MELARDILLILHFIGLAGVLGGLLASQAKLNKGVLHSALLSLVSGISLVGIRYPLHDSDPDRWGLPDNAKITVKLLILFGILVLGYRNAKKDSLPKNTWMTMTLLAVANIVIAVMW